MPLAQWPNTLHHGVLREGFMIEPARPPLTTEVESGPDLREDADKTRIDRLRVRIVFTDAQLATFRAFVSDTLSNGAADFVMPVPFDGSTYSPRRVYIDKGRWSVEPRALKWMVSFTLCVFRVALPEEDE